MELQDNAAESAVIAGICRYGNDAYIEVEDLGIKAQTFKNIANYNIFLCIQKVAKEGDLSLDIPTLFSAAKDLGNEHILKQPAVLEHINKVFALNVNKNNIRKLAAKIKKLEIGRLITQQLDDTKLEVSKITGDEKLAHILGIAENAILDFSSLLTEDDNPKQIGPEFEGHVKYLSENKVDQLGIPTGYSRLDKVLGGGLRTGTHVFAARPKTGKTTCGINIGFNVSDIDVPVLALDTEMTYDDHLNKIIALNTEVPTNDIECGKFIENPDFTHKINNFVNNNKNLDYSHKSICGMPFEDQIGVMRRWIHKKVGLKPNGKANKCLIVYDYLKLMDSGELNAKDLTEFQLLGFMMTGLQNFALKYDIPIVLFIQLNRDGITKETSDVASGSDRIAWFCTSMTIFKPKSDEEIGVDGPHNGNRKMVTILSRYGEGSQDGDYISYFMKGWCAKITEGKTRFEIANNKDDDGFTGNNDAIPFN